LIAFDAPQRQRVPTKAKQPAPLREQTGVFSGVRDFFAIGDGAGTDILLAPFQEGGAPLAQAGSDILSGNIFAFDIDPTFDPAKAGERTAQILLG